MNTSWTETSWEAYWTGLQNQVLNDRKQQQDTAMMEPADDKLIMRLWRECGLDESFLGNAGTNHRLVEFVRLCSVLPAFSSNKDEFLRLIAEKSTDPYARSLAKTALRGDPVPVRPERADDLDRPAA